MSIKVSIVLAVSYQDKYVCPAIESCLNQSLSSIEIFVVGDLTNSAAAKIPGSYPDSRVHFIQVSKETSVSRLWNIGLSKASGDFLMVLTDTDRLKPDALDKMTQWAATEPASEIIFADTYFVSADDDYQELFSIPNNFRFSDLEGVSRCFLFSRNVYNVVGKFSEEWKSAELYEYWIRAAKKFSLKHVPGSLGECVVFKNQFTRKERTDNYFVVQLLKYHRGYLSAPRFFNAVETYLKRLKKVSKSQKEYLDLVLKALGRVARLSPFMGGVFVLVGLSLAWTYLFRPVINLCKLLYVRTYLMILKDRVRRDGDAIDVLCVIPEVVVGGSEKVLWDIVTGLKPKGYRFHLLAARNQNNEWCKQFCRIFQCVILLPGRFLVPTGNVEEKDLYYQYLSELTRIFNVQVVLNSNAFYFYFVLPQYKQHFPGVKVMDLIHLEDYAGASDEHVPMSPFVDRRICISGYLKKHLTKKYSDFGLDPSLVDRLSVIYNGNDMDQFDPAKCPQGKFRKRYKVNPQMKIISYVARVARAKRPELFVDMANHLLKKDPKAPLMFVIAGDGEDLSSIKERIKYYKIEKNFILTGMLTKAEVMEVLSDSYLMVIVSMAEGLPLVLVEAMSLNVPVITTRVGAVEEAITSGIDGFVIPLHEDVAENAARIISELLADPSRYDDIKRKVRPSVIQKFSMDVMTQEYANSFQQLIKNENP